MPFFGNENAQNTSARKVHVKKEFQRPNVSLPIFFHRIATYNVRDSAGNTSGTRLVSSLFTYIFCLQRPVVLNFYSSSIDSRGRRIAALILAFLIQDVPLSFVEKHGIQLQPHVKLQGIREESPFRTITCSYNMLQDSEERSRTPLLLLGCGDFVRDNALLAGQELLFTLTAESFSSVREVCEIIVYTK